MNKFTQTLKNLRNRTMNTTTNNNKQVNNNENKKESVFDKFDTSQMTFAPLGSSKSFFIDNELKLEHGTCPQLMSKASYLLQRDFELNSEKDYFRYFCKSKYTYYAVIQQKRHKTTVDCALRVVLDDIEHPKVVLLDFIRTRSKCKGKGLATLLINFVLEGCANLDSNVYVTSTKEAKSYWARFGFIKEKNEDADYALNEFKDCTLLTLPTNKYIEFPSDDEEDSTSNEYSTSSDTESSSSDSESSSSEESTSYEYCYVDDSSSSSESSSDYDSSSSSEYYYY